MVERLPAFFRRPGPWLALAPALVLAAWLTRGVVTPAIEVYQVSAAPLVANVVATGRVQTRSRVTIGSEITGTLVERLVAEGAGIAAGDLVARLEDREQRARVSEAAAALGQLAGRQRPEAAAALAAAEVRHDQAGREAARQRELAGRGLVATERAEQAEQALQLAEAEWKRARVVAAALASGGVEETLLRERLATARAQLARTEIRSQVAGTVLRRLAEPGDVVTAGRGIVELAVDGATEVVAAVDERSLDRLQLGQPALVSADAFPDERVPGSVTFIAPAVDVQTGTIEIRVVVPDPPANLRQDMTVSIDVEVGRRERALVIPTDALRESAGDRAAVLRLRAGRIERVAIRVGLRGLGLAEVLEGLDAGDLVLPGSSTPAAGSRARPRR
ncbi:MAG: efflux RND transporter periplasmic adaptor subunit [Gammaproteobacteria bacterium]|nr:MAG: efflux RND transporter periplasmic adaptor subunit [Gammaproteobacteria bacterium]